MPICFECTLNLALNFRKGPSCQFKIPLPSQLYPSTATREHVYQATICQTVKAKFYTKRKFSSSISICDRRKQLFKHQLPCQKIQEVLFFPPFGLNSKNGRVVRIMHMTCFFLGWQRVYLLSTKSRSEWMVSFRLSRRSLPLEEIEWSISVFIFTSVTE